MQTTKTRPASTPPSRRIDYRYGILAGVVLALFLAGWLGYSLHTVTHHDVTLAGSSFTGKIDILDGEHTAGCVQAASQRVCSGFYVQGGQTIRVGETVRAVHEVYKNANGDGFDFLVIFPQNTP